MDNNNSNNMDLCTELWERYEPQIRKICMLKLSDHPEEIDEIISDTYLALCEALKSGKKISNYSSYLYGTANNKIKQKFKQLKKYRQRHTYSGDIVYNLTYDIDYIDAIITDDDIDIIKNEIISELSDSEKMLLDFVYEDKLKLKEIANIINSTEAAVKQKRYRLTKRIKITARDKCKKYL